MTKNDAMGALEARLSAGPDADHDSAELARRFAEVAAESGEAEVAFATIDTPVGTTSIAATHRGIVAVGLPNHPLDEFVERLAREISPRVVEAPTKLDEARRELDEYFSGRRQRFDLALDWILVPGGFYGKVLEVTATLRYGEVMTYGDVAREAGNPRAHRAAGTAVGINPLPIVVPCHRVVRAGGGNPGNYGGGPELKRWLLELESSL